MSALTRQTQSTNSMRYVTCVVAKRTNQTKTKSEQRVETHWHLCLRGQVLGELAKFEAVGGTIADLMQELILVPSFLFSKRREAAATTWSGIEYVLEQACAGGVALTSRLNVQSYAKPSSLTNNVLS
eukprot:3496006-Amphidinium_carterae.1